MESKIFSKTSPVVTWREDYLPESFTLGKKVGKQQQCEFLLLVAFSKATIDWFAKGKEKRG